MTVRKVILIEEEGPEESYEGLTVTTMAAVTMEVLPPSSSA